MPSSARLSSLWRSPRKRRLLVIVSVGIVAALLMGSFVVGAHEQAERGAIAPVEWRGIREGDSTGGGMRIRLEPDGRAQVTGAPRGEVARQDRGEARQNRNGRRHLCVRPTGTGVYSGPATWDVVGERGIRVQFEDSSLILRAGRSGSILREPDWNRPRMTECGDGGRTWFFDRVG